MTRATILIPARLHSTRLPRKLLLDLNGKSVLQRTIEGCLKTYNASVIVLTEDQEIYDHAIQFCDVIMTDKFNSGTERITSVLNRIGGAIVNVQGDEPFVDAMDINFLVDCIYENPLQIYTMDRYLKESEYKDRSCVKLLKDLETNSVSIFTRSPIYKNNSFGKHIGIYAFSKKTLELISTFSQSENSIQESLEQLTWLDNGLEINSVFTYRNYISIDTELDLKKANIYAKGYKI